MNQPKDLLSIGTFANLTRLLIKALRLYDELGILQPLRIGSKGMALRRLVPCVRFGIQILMQSGRLSSCSNECLILHDSQA